MVFVGTSKFGKTNLIFADTGIKVTAHTGDWAATACRAWELWRVLLSSSKTVLLHTELVRQAAIWNGRHSLSFEQTCASQQSRSEPGWLWNLGKNAAAELPDKSSWHCWNEAAYTMSGMWIGAKREQWCNKRVTQMSSLYSCRRRIFQHLI